jgi:hypothetical protein
LGPHRLTVTIQRRDLENRIDRIAVFCAPLEKGRRAVRRIVGIGSGYFAYAKA